mgnify:FL=1
MSSDTIDISLGSSGNLKSSNFGGGIELLMNEKVKDTGSDAGSVGNDINIGDLDDLEADLNNLTDDIASATPARSELFSDSLNDAPTSVKFDTSDDKVNIGEATANIQGDQSTWDGYAKFNDIPIDPEANVKTTQQPQMSKEELLREKFKFLRKLEALEKKGVELSKKYTMESSLLELSLIHI